MIKLPAFIKNVLTLSVGVILSQILGLIFIPILSRLYSPESYGVYSTLVGISQLFILLSTMKYDKALIISKSTEQLPLLVLISFIVSLISILSLIFVFFIYLFNFRLNLSLMYLFLIPVAILGYGMISAILNISQRKERYKIVSFISFLQTLINILISLVIGVFWYKTNGLILGWILSPFVVLICYLCFHYKKILFVIKSVRFYEILDVWRKYINFPKYYLLYDLLFTSFPFVLPIVLTKLFSTIAAGYFSMTYRILMVPFLVISSSVSNVFVINANQNYSSVGRFNTLYLKTFKKIILIGIIIYSMLFLFGGKLIPIVLGAKWNNIIDYIRVLSVWMLFEFISVVFKSNTYIIVQKQYIGLIIQVFNTLAGVMSLILFSSYGIITALAMFAFTMSFFCILNIVITYKLSK